jgi:hypothetical protein
MILGKSVEKIQIWLKSGTLREDVSTVFVTGDIKSTYKRPFQMKRYQAIRRAEEV